MSKSNPPPAGVQAATVALHTTVHTDREDDPPGWECMGASTWWATWPYDVYWWVGEPYCLEPGDTYRWFEDWAAVQAALDAVAGGTDPAEVGEAWDDGGVA